jgi:hypothetical protein
MIAERTKDFSPVYSSWFGKPVVMGTFLKDSESYVLSDSATTTRYCLTLTRYSNARGVQDA